MQQMLDLLSAKADANPLVNWGNFEMRRYKDQLYFINTQVRFFPKVEYLLLARLF
jgi:tRNA(Ile)-lysidine synthase